MSAADVIGPDLEARVSRVLGRPVRDLAPMPGGHSGITLVGETEASRKVVVKVAAPGRPAVGRHDVMRQVRAMSAAAPYVPVPDVLAVEEGEQPLAVLSFERGVATEPAIDETGAELPGDLVSARFEAAASLLAALHRVPVEEVGDAPTVTPADELAQFARIGRAGEPDFVEAAEQAADVLGRDVPGPWRTGLVHGDYRLGNILFDGTSAVAIVDWEIWNVGDPRVDLGWMATFASTEPFPGIARTDVELPGPEAVVRSYAAAVGAAVPDADWFLRLGAFRMGAMMSHNLKRHRTGRHVDPYQEKLPPTIERLLALASGQR